MSGFRIIRFAGKFRCRNNCFLHFVLQFKKHAVALEPVVRSTARKSIIDVFKASRPDRDRIFQRVGFQQNNGVMGLKIPTEDGVSSICGSSFLSPWYVCGHDCHHWCLEGFSSGVLPIIICEAKRRHLCGTSARRIIYTYAGGN